MPATTDDPAPVGAAEHALRVPGDGPAGPLDEHGFRRAGRDRVPVGRCHLGRRQHEPHLLLPVVGQPNDGLGEQLDQTDPTEHVVAHDRLDLRHLVGDGLVAIAVALEHPAGGVGAEPIEEPHVEQRDAGRLRALHLGHEDQRAVVGAAAPDGDLALARDAVLGTAQHRVVVGARRDVAGDPAPVDDVHRRAPRAGSPSMR